MAQLDLHGGIIGWPAGTRQGAKAKQCADEVKNLQPSVSLA
jgi:ribulose 1,5-bisphosphate carboxylase large subunit-like protein